MKTLLAAVFIVTCLLRGDAAEPEAPVSQEEVNRLTIAAALLDYPTSEKAALIAQHIAELFFTLNDIPVYRKGA